MAASETTFKQTSCVMAFLMLLTSLIIFSNSKWKASKRELYSICVGPYERTLLSGGKMIKLWDLKTKTSLRVSLNEINIFI